MRARGQGMVVLVAMAATAAAVQQTVHGCECERPAPLSTEVRREAPFVFSGTVVEIVERQEHTTTTIPGGATTSVRPLDRSVVFRVAAGWRGVARERFDITDEIDSCLFPFEIGGEYLVFAHVDPRGRTRTDVCTRTMPLEAAAAILELLGPPAYRAGGHDSAGSPGRVSRGMADRHTGAGAGDHDAHSLPDDRAANVRPRPSASRLPISRHS